MVPLSRGETVGPASDLDEQTRRVRAAVELLETREEPGIIVD